MSTRTPDNLYDDLWPSATPPVHPPTEYETQVLAAMKDLSKNIEHNYFRAGLANVPPR